MDSNIEQQKVPKHLWLISLFFLFIYSIGIYDFFMVLGHNEAYYNSNNFGPAVVEYFTDYPLIPLFFWATNLLSGFIAPILLLFRSKWALKAAFVSAISIIILQLITFTFMNRWNVLGPWISMFDIVILILTVLFYFYCKKISTKILLR